MQPNRGPPNADNSRMPAVEVARLATVTLDKKFIEGALRALTQQNEAPSASPDNPLFLEHAVARTAGKILAKAFEAWLKTAPNHDEPPHSELLVTRFELAVREIIQNAFMYDLLGVTKDTKRAATNGDSAAQQAIVNAWDDLPGSASVRLTLDIVLNHVVVGLKGSCIQPVASLEAFWRNPRFDHRELEATGGGNGFQQICTCLSKVNQEPGRRYWGESFAGLVKMMQDIGARVA